MRNRLACALMLALVLCCLQMVVPRRALACSCMMPPSVQAAVSDADAVFLGTVISVTPRNSAGPNTWASNEAAFSILTVWKGVMRPQALLVTGSGGGDCGFVFNPGDTYLVYAYSSHPGAPVISIGNFRFEIPLGAQQFGTSICTRTVPLAHAASDLAQLGPGTQPTQNDLSGFVLDNLLAVIAGVIALIIALILYLMRRKRRRTFRLKP